jgi:hypothetical protein
MSSKETSRLLFRHRQSPCRPSFGIHRLTSFSHRMWLTSHSCLPVPIIFESDPIVLFELKLTIILKLCEECLQLIGNPPITVFSRIDRNQPEQFLILFNLSNIIATLILGGTESGRASRVNYVEISVVHASPNAMRNASDPFVRGFKMPLRSKSDSSIPVDVRHGIWPQPWDIPNDERVERVPGNVGSAKCN